MLLGAAGNDFSVWNYLIAPTAAPLMLLLPDPSHYKTVWVDIMDMALLFSSHILLYAYLGVWIFRLVPQLFRRATGPEGNM